MREHLSLLVCVSFVFFFNFENKLHIKLVLSFFSCALMARAVYKTAALLL